MKINVGCGRDIRDDFVNLDTYKNDNADMVCELPKRLPFKNEVVDYLYCSHVLEDFDSETQRDIIKDFHRVLKKGGKLHLLMPHFRNPEFFSSGFHTRPASKGMLNWAIKKNLDYNSEVLFSKVLKLRINFWSRKNKRNKIYYIYGWLLEPLVNINSTTQYIYEMFIGSIFPCHEVEWVLQK